MSGLTRGQAMNLKAGRELDQAVAEIVFGWQRVNEYPEDWRRRNPGYHPDAISPWTGRPCAFNGPWWVPPGRTIDDSPVNGMACPDYSTDIAAAFTVVEKMREKAWEVRIFGGSPLDTHPDYIWDVTFEHPESFDASGNGCSSSLAEACCRAALIAHLEE